MDKAYEAEKSDLPTAKSTDEEEKAHA